MATWKERALKAEAELATLREKVNKQFLRRVTGGWWCDGCDNWATAHAPGCVVQEIDK